MVASRVHRDGFGSLLGILVFLAGIGMLGLTFRLAYDMFNVPPSNALGLKAGQTLDFGVAGNSLAVVILRVVLLVVMGLMGSLISNRGVHLYGRSLTHAPTPPDASA